MEETSGGMCPQFNRAQSVCFLKIELWSEITHMFQLFLLRCMRPEGPWQRLLRICVVIYIYPPGWAISFLRPVCPSHCPHLAFPYRALWCHVARAGPLSLSTPFPESKNKAKRTKQNRYTGKAKNCARRKKRGRRNARPAPHPVPPTRGDLCFHLSFPPSPPPEGGL